MIDLETLGTGPDVIVVSVGAVLFDADTGETGGEFYRILDYQDQIDLGRKPSADIIKWWMEQTNEARSVFKDGVSLANDNDR
jgi:hypothetical protein